MGPMWTPSPERVESALITAFSRKLAERHAVALPDYASLWRWSIDHKWDFWRAMWDFGGVFGAPGDRVLEDADRMPGARWFVDARLNFARNLLERKRANDETDALVFWGEDKVKQRLTHAELHALSSRTSSALAAHGIVAGDRVAGYLPNMPETVIAMLAATARGATWSSCSPDFGVQGVVDRFGQIEPRVLVLAEGYYYGGKSFDCLDKAAEIAAQLPSLKRVVVVPYTRESPSLAGLPLGTMLADYVATCQAKTIAFARLPFAHPLFILYSSGTTGVPKCIVHGAGG